MGWQAAAALNVLIALSYVVIAALIVSGLLRTRQLASNPLGAATAAIFTTCALHHGHHATHLFAVYADAPPGQLVAVRDVFGEWHTVAIDLVGAVVAVTYLALRRNYKALLNTPQMFDDAVRVAAEQRLHELAYTDLLTGVPNRAAFSELSDELAEGPDQVVVLYVDLDGFKGINDEHGHDAGDRVLRDTAQRLHAAAGPGEHVFRIGGDELVVVAVGRDEADGRELARRAADRIAEPVVMRAGVVRVGASIGVAWGAPGTPVESLLREADRDMYTVKAARRAAAGLVLPRAAAEHLRPLPSA